MTKAPLLSICIPTYNRLVWLQRGLESISATWQPGIEVVITDDSHDQQARVIAETVLGTGNYRYEHHERPLGMAQNWNRAKKGKRCWLATKFGIPAVFERKGTDHSRDSEINICKALSRLC